MSSSRHSSGAVQAPGGSANTSSSSRPSRTSQRTKSRGSKPQAEVAQRNKKPQNREPERDDLELDTTMTGIGQARSLTSPPPPTQGPEHNDRSEDEEEGEGEDEDGDGDGDGNQTEAEAESGGDEEGEGEAENDEDDDDLDDGDDNLDDEDEDEEGHGSGRMGGLDGFGFDPFGSFGSGSDGPSFAQTLRAIHGMVHGTGGRLRELLSNLRRKDDQSVQLIALNELAEFLLVSTEDNLVGQFSSDAFVKELVSLMQTEDNPEIMLLACRCITNMIEALPSSVTNVVNGGAVLILCQKLLEISFIDLAEQALTTLEKISVEYPTSIVREGGLTACLSYLEFFATATQRSAVTTAANCCRNVPEDCFGVVRDVMPTLLGIFNSNDQRVVEQASLCVTGIVESFRFYPSKLEELVGEPLLRTVLRLLVPGATNMVGANIHTQFLRMLGFVAHASPRLSAELYKLNVVETLYSVLTGVSPPGENQDPAAKLDSVVVTQALIHRPRDQIIETLNVVCELLPTLPSNANPAFGDFVEGSSVTEPQAQPDGSPVVRTSPNSLRIQLLQKCQPEVRRFALILFPTLMDAYSSTMNLSVRQKVLTAHTQMLSNLDRGIIAEALSTVPYASFLTSILSQGDDPTLVMYALQAAELLLARIDDLYRYQLYREGVMSEVTRLATAELPPEPKPRNVPPEHDTSSDDSEDSDNSDEEERQGDKGDEGAGRDKEGNEDEDDHTSSEANDLDRNEVEHDDAMDQDNDNSEDGNGNDVDDDNSQDGEVEIEDQDEDDDGYDDSDDEGDDNDEDTDEEEYKGEDVENHDEDDGSGISSTGSAMSLDVPPPRGYQATPNLPRRIQDVAKRFLELHENEPHDAEVKLKANKILGELAALANELEAFYVHQAAKDLSPGRGEALIAKLASYFTDDVLESITSAELLASGLVRVLVEILDNPADELARAARAPFLEIFMSHPAVTKPQLGATDSPSTPFGVMIHKLQDVLSRAEHFEVVTVHHGMSDGGRNNATSMLAKQIKLRLVAEDDSEVPKALRNIMVSIHAIATFKSLDDYLRPRISVPDRLARASRTHNLSRALAVMANQGGLTGALAARLSDPSFLSSASHIPPPPQPLQPPTAAQTNSPPATAASGSGAAPKPKPNTASQPHTPTKPTQASGSSTGGSSLRRSSRRQPVLDDAPMSPAPPAPPAQDEEDLQETLECADENQMSEDEEIGEGGALDAIVGDLEDAPTPDPSAVNLEVATSGKVTARREDGTRILTPSQSSASSLHRASTAPLSRPPGTPTPTSSSSGRPPSYAAALQTAPQDWHIEFSLDGKVVPNETTIYRAVHALSASAQPGEHSSRSIWSAIHPIKFRRVSGPPTPAGRSFSFSPNPESSSPEPETEAVPNSLAKHPSTVLILRLLNILHNLNANRDDVLVEHKGSLHLNVEPLSQFVNTKLTAKLNRQLEEPLIVASNCLPGWAEDLARVYPFVFPFETRHLFLQSTSFGYARSMARWQNAQGEEQRRDWRDERPFLGRLQRQKVRISRAKILESALKVMELYGTSQSILEVEYFEEVGTGLGPTLEFYSTVSREFAKKKLRLWREVDTNDSDEFISTTNGLFPRPMSDDEAASPNGERILHLFKMLGKFVARSMIDSRIIDVNFNPIIFRVGDGPFARGVKLSLGAARLVDPGLARSLKTIKKFSAANRAIEEDPTRTPAQKVTDTEAIAIDGVTLDDLCLDFTLPGYPEIELVEQGSRIKVSIDNVDLYLDRVLDMTLGSGVRRQIAAFRSGFSQVFPYSALSSFTPDELVTLFGSSEEDWSLETLMDSIKADHGYNMDSRSVKNLLHVMSEFNAAERRQFLQFTTGSPKLPIGGFKSLTPMFTVVMRSKEPPYTFDSYLPSVMTCVNYLKLPDYSSIEVLRKQLTTAIREGQGAFHLS